jgi:hypothetical protein
MATKGISGTAVAAVFAGGILLWSGIKGFSVSTTFRDLLAGKNPATQTPTQSVTPGGLVSSLIPGGVLGGLLGGSSGGSSPVQSVGGGVGGTAAQNKALGQRMAAAFGWTGAQWTALNNIAMAESGWRTDATNPSSGAYGIPQALPASKLATAGSNWRTSAAVQIAWMLRYIKSTYGNPVNAWNFHLAHGWY